jgi:hypothetical protein
VKEVRRIDRGPDERDPAQTVVLARGSTVTWLLHRCDLLTPPPRVDAARRMVVDATGCTPQEALRLMEEAALVADTSIEQVAENVIAGTISFQEIPR